jgi:predicted type IV restriction endonuclease
MSELNFVEELEKVMRDPKVWIIYRGYSAKVNSDKTVTFGDAQFVDKKHFRAEIDRLAKARYQALSNSIERSENILNK